LFSKLSPPTASSRPFTEIKQVLTWESVIHLGDRYAALLVEPGYIPPNKMPELPTKGGSVLAIITVPGTAPHAKTIHFSGYNWEARQNMPRRRNLWVTDMREWAPEARLAQPANPMWDSAASAFHVCSKLVCPLR
jgi:hypothetical protein